MSSKKRHKKRNFLIIMILIFASVSAALAINAAGNEKELNTNSNEKEPQQNSNEEPKQEEVEKNPDVTINIAATGDIMFHPSQIEGAYDKSTDTYDFRNSFKAVKDIFQSADLSIGNFEGTTAGNETYAYQGYPLFNAPDEALEAIKDAGFDVLSTANNHCLDTRKAGIIRTVEQINKQGMNSIGTYTKKPESRVLIKDVKGIKIAFMSYTEMVNGLEAYMDPADLDAMVNIIDETKMKEDIAYAKEQNVDLIVFYMHWGIEYARTQSDFQEQTAEMLLNEGVDIILGSHPHVIQPSQTVEINGEKKLVAYSMGNFLSNQRVETLVPYGMSEEEAKYTEDGVIINIEIEKKGETGVVSIKNIEYIPLWVYKGTDENGSPEHIVYPIDDFVESDDLNNNSKTRMNRSYKDTMAQMDNN
ncbi:MAG: CapA family protein [Bacillota bacterium]|jgi:poly-gamma-glutamate synthesis protein (capsule biosynthesis protein)|nr:CapA family protein [Bacillota bacterium]